RADIDYGFAEANTTYGKIGVKVWIFRGEILPSKNDKVVEKNIQKQEAGVLVNEGAEELDVEGEQKNVTTN
ncbi:MAG TPA: 30S ribosomal protein S3, partial [Candidatus Atribacteria bacterium]|nr:30S ribosomal protein S3 [Candidatus Atribacteria bacterium]